MIIATIAAGLSSSLVVALSSEAPDPILIVAANVVGVAIAGVVMRLSGPLIIGVMLVSGLFQFLATRAGSSLM